LCVAIFSVSYTKFLPLLTFFRFRAEWWDKYNKIPTVEQVFGVLTMPTNDLEKEENAKSKALLIWYYDRYLPIAAGKEYWQEDIRYYKRPTDKINVNGAQKVCVTVASEAFGLLMLTNCVQKWPRMYQFKIDNPGEKVPDKGDAAIPYKGRWTDSKCGRVAFGGWAEEAYEFFEAYKEKVKHFWATDAANGYDTQNYALKILRESKGIDRAAPGKKRKRSKKGTPPKPVAPRKITREEE